MYIIIDEQFCYYEYIIINTSTCMHMHDYLMSDFNMKAFSNGYSKLGGNKIRESKNVMLSHLIPQQLHVMYSITCTYM